MGKLAEGKTKIIWTGPDPDQVEIESKDDITAGDGDKKDLILGKAKLANETTCNCFKLLDKKGVRNHFIWPGNEKTFIAQDLKMIPIEIVMRRIATGSYLKRNPSAKEGDHFAPVVVELFFKDDKLHDPIMIWDGFDQRYKLHDPHKPVNRESYIRDLLPEEILTPQGHPFSWEEASSLRAFGAKTFYVLEMAWKQLDHALIDLKIECGWDKNGEMMVGDVIDNDSWRLRKGSKNGKALDKQIYRDLKNRDAESLETVRQNYARVAELSREFPYL